MKIVKEVGEIKWEKGVDHYKTISDDWIICNDVPVFIPTHRNPIYDVVGPNSNVHFYLSRTNYLIGEGKFATAVSLLSEKKACVAIHFPYDNTELYSSIVDAVSTTMLIQQRSRKTATDDDPNPDGRIILLPEDLDMKHEYDYDEIFVNIDGEMRKVQITRRIRWVDVSDTVFKSDLQCRKLRLEDIAEFGDDINSMCLRDRIVDFRTQM